MQLSLATNKCWEKLLVCWILLPKKFAIIRSAGSSSNSFIYLFPNHFNILIVLLLFFLEKSTVTELDRREQNKIKRNRNQPVCGTKLERPMKKHSPLFVATLKTKLSLKMVHAN